MTADFRIMASLALSIVLSSVLVASAGDVGEEKPAPKELQLMSASKEHRAAQLLYAEHCANCHEGGIPNAPHSVTFLHLGPETVLNALESGVMRQQGSALSKNERFLLAEYLGGRPLATNETPVAPVCQGPSASFDRQRPPRSTGWGITLESTRFIEDPGLDYDEIPKLRLKWAFAYPNATRARSQPLVAAGAVFVGSQDGSVYALDLESGCILWRYRASAEVRVSPSLDSWENGDDSIQPRLYFGDMDGWVYALDAFSGEEIWKVHLDDHPTATITGSPRLYKDRLYVPMSSTEWASAADPAYECCTFRGGIAAFDTASGELVWKSYVIPDEPQRTGEKTSTGAPRWHPAGGAVWNSPTVDVKRKLLYVGTGQAYTSPAAKTSDAVVAFHMETGEIAWSWQATSGDAWNFACILGLPDNCPAESGKDFDIGTPPVLLTLSDGKDVLLAGQKSGDVYALDPEQRKLLWNTKIGIGGFAGGVHWGMAAQPDILFAPNADTDFIGDNPPKARRPGLYALEPRTGKILWYKRAPDRCPEDLRPACDPGLSAPPTAIPGVIFAGGYDGMLRAYEQASGAILWEYDTNREFPTVSGETGKGGSIESDGPVITEGKLLVNSGYSYGGRMAGNVLLVFEPSKNP